MTLLKKHPRVGVATASTDHFPKPDCEACKHRRGELITSKVRDEFRERRTANADSQAFPVQSQLQTQPVMHSRCNKVCADKTNRH